MRAKVVMPFTIMHPGPGSYDEMQRTNSMLYGLPNPGYVNESWDYKVMHLLFLQTHGWPYIADTFSKLSNFQNLKISNSKR